MKPETGWAALPTEKCGNACFKDALNGDGKIPGRSIQSAKLRDLTKRNITLPIGTKVEGSRLDRCPAFCPYVVMQFYGHDANGP